MKNPPSIRQELLRSLFRSLVLLYAAGSLVIYLIVQEAIERRTNELLRQKLRDFAEDTRVFPEGMPGRDGGPGAIFHDFFDWEYGQLYSDTGVPLKTSAALKGGTLPFRKVQERTIPVEDISLPDGRPGRVGFLSFRPKSHRRRPHEFRNMPPPPPSPPVHLTVAIPVGDERLTLQILAFTLLSTGVLLGAAVFFIVRYQVEKSYRPVEDLVDLTNTIQPDQLSLRLPCDEVPVELSPLVGQFNTLLDRLETAFIRERSFSANIGHEIRTPLTELAALLGNAVEDLKLDKPEESPAEVYADANEICQHMNRLIEVISSIHQAESGRALVSVTKVDPCSVLQDVLALQQAAGEGIEIRDRRKPELREIETDEILLKAIFQNLVSNAIRHSRDGTPIICKLENQGAGGFRFEITNTPENDIESADLQRISEPFWQKDSSHTDQDNFGLGLSLVEKYADLIEANTAYILKNGQFVANLQVPDLSTKADFEEV